MIFFILITILILVIIVIFASPALSPIPYFPSNHRDLPLIIKALNLKNEQVIFDMGAGDGVIVLDGATHAHAKKLNTQFVAIEMNPILIAILHLRRLFHPNKKNIHIIYGDMFKADYTKFFSPSNTITIYMYVSPRFIPKIINHMKPILNHFEVVSYFYPIEPNLKPTDTGVHDVYRKTF